MSGLESTIMGLIRWYTGQVSGNHPTPSALRPVQTGSTPTRRWILEWWSRRSRLR